jgi:sulfite reductase alpha subunit-like flavoprotein
MAPNVALVYGSFFMGDSERNIGDIKEGFPKIDGLELAEPVEGNAFDFNTLKDCKMLIVCTSSQYGMPPPNFKEFAHQLLLAATSNPGCLSHLQHAVYGNGDETYFKTYMNMPRYVDLLLEKCGSRRFFARGETGEPNSALETSKCEVKDWVPAMWSAAAQAAKDGSTAPAVAWDALWEKEAGENHHDVTEFDLKKLVAKLGDLKSSPSMFSKL